MRSLFLLRFRRIEGQQQPTTNAAVVAAAGKPFVKYFYFFKKTGFYLTLPSLRSRPDNRVSSFASGLRLTDFAEYSVRRPSTRLPLGIRRWDMQLGRLEDVLAVAIR